MFHFFHFFIFLLFHFFHFFIFSYFFILFHFFFFFVGCSKSDFFLGLDFVTISLDSSCVKNQFWGPSRVVTPLSPLFLFFLLFFLPFFFFFFFFFIFSHFLFISSFFCTLRPVHLQAWWAVFSPRVCKVLAELGSRGLGLEGGKQMDLLLVAGSPFVNPCALLSHQGRHCRRHRDVHNH